MEEEDYWNTSETKTNAFNFDDDILSPREILAIGQKTYSSQESDGVFNNSVASTKPSLLPLETLVQPKVLDIILSAQSGKGPETKQDFDETIEVSLKRLVLRRNCSLHAHRSISSKTKLLDGALAIGDGNAILAVLLFLVQTLNRKLLYELLACRPIALAHYISFLHTERKITELSDFLVMLGRSPDSAIYQFQHLVKTQGDNVESLLIKLNNCMRNHFDQPGIDSHQTKMVADYIKLLEWQKHANKAELNNKPALFCLAHACNQHWHEGAGNAMSPLTICQRQQISPVQFDWVALNVHGKNKKWDIVESLITKKDWLGRTTVTSHIPMGTLLAKLNEFGASTKLMANCVNKVPSTEERLHLAHTFKIHSVVIDTLAKQKDRIALSSYKMALSPQSEEYFLADSALRDTSIRWKN